MISIISIAYRRFTKVSIRRFGFSTQRWFSTQKKTVFNLKPKSCCSLKNHPRSIDRMLALVKYAQQTKPASLL